jgi:secondary thiamine-phosphate synthase enzyme
MSAKEITMVFQDKLNLHTRGHGEMHDVTARVNDSVRRSGVRTGIAHVFCIGSTATVGTIEFEPGLQKDLPQMLDRLIPPSRDYGHEETWHDGNGHSHLQATLMGPGLSAPVTDAQLLLGTWQQVILLECDVRPRERTLVVTVIGE